MTTNKYSKMSYRDLKEEARNRDLTSTGKKTVIIARLLENDEKYTKKPGEIFVHIKTLSGSWYNIKIKQSKTGLELREILYQKSNIPIEKQRLSIITDGRNDPLKDGTSLSKQGMYHDSFCRLDIRFLK